MHRDVLLIDLDGVLRQWNASVDRIELKFGLPTGTFRKIAFAPEVVSPAIQGVITDEEWRASVLAKLEAMHGQPMRLAVDEWSEHAGEVDRRTVALVDRCRQDTQVVLVTNATSRLPGDLERLGIADRFADVVNSSDVLHAKPSREIYEVALRRAGVTAARAVFIDDQLANVLAADDLGILGHHFQSHDGMESFLVGAGLIDEAAT